MKRIAQYALLAAGASCTPAQQQVAAPGVVPSESSSGLASAEQSGSFREPFPAKVVAAEQPNCAVAPVPSKIEAFANAFVTRVALRGSEWARVLRFRRLEYSDDAGATWRLAFDSTDPVMSLAWDRHARIWGSDNRGLLFAWEGGIRNIDAGQRRFPDGAGPLFAIGPHGIPLFVDRAGGRVLEVSDPDFPATWPSRFVVAEGQLTDVAAWNDELVVSTNEPSAILTPEQRVVFAAVERLGLLSCGDSGCAMIADGRVYTSKELETWTDYGDVFAIAASCAGASGAVGRAFGSGSDRGWFRSILDADGEYERVAFLLRESDDNVVEESRVLVLSNGVASLLEVDARAENVLWVGERRLWVTGDGVQEYLFP